MSPSLYPSLLLLSFPLSSFPSPLFFASLPTCAHVFGDLISAHSFTMPTLRRSELVREA